MAKMKATILILKIKASVALKAFCCILQLEKYSSPESSFGFKCTSSFSMFVFGYLTSQKLGFVSMFMYCICSLVVS